MFIPPRIDISADHAKIGFFAEAAMLLVVEEAQKRFEELLELALNGEEVLISEQGKLVQLMPLRKYHFNQATGRLSDFPEVMNVQVHINREGANERSR